MVPDLFLKRARNIDSRSAPIKTYFGQIPYCLSFAIAVMLRPKDKDMAESTTSKTTKRKPNAAFAKPVTPDEKLAKVVGPEPVPRTELTKKLWEYIRKHKLQDPAAKTFIKADDALKDVFGGKDRVSMFEMTKLVSNHVK